MKLFYLFAAILGAILPDIFFPQYFSNSGLSLRWFVSALFGNGASAGFTADLLFTSFVFWLFMVIQQRMNGGPKPYINTLLNLKIDLSCALPAYLYARESS